MQSLALWPPDWPESYISTIVIRFESALCSVQLDAELLSELRDARAVFAFYKADTAFVEKIVTARKSLAGLYEKYPLAALLTQTIKQDSETFDMLVGLVAASTLILLNRSSDNDNKTKLACDAVRILAAKGEFATLALFHGNATLDECLETAVKGEDEPNTSRDKLRCGYIHPLLHAVRYFKRPKTRPALHDDDNGDGYITSDAAALVIDADDDNGLSSVIIKQATMSQHSYNIEQDPVHREYSVAPSGQSEEYTNLPLQRYRQTQQVAAWLKRRMALPTQFGSFTPFEIGRVLDFCFKEPTAPSRTIILGTLLTGLRPEAIIELLRDPNNRGSGRWLSQEDEQAYLCTKLDLPQNRKHVEPIALKLLTPVHHLRIEIPMELAQRLEEIDVSVLTVEQVQHEFSALWNTSGRKQTLVRLSSVLRDRLVALGKDSTIAGLIYGETAQNLPGLYYVTHDRDHINAAYQGAIASLDSNRRWTFGPLTGGNCGSEIFVLNDRVQKFFIVANDELDFLREKWKRHRSPHNLTRFHNLFAALTLFSLLLLTGHRPVNNPFDRLSDFDLDRRLLFISDKEVRYSPAGRFVPLASKAIDQLKAWCSHIERLRTIEHEDDNELALKCKEAIGSDGSLIFTLGDARLTGLGPPHDVRCGALREMWNDNIWPLPLNWGRHLQRRLLLRVRTELADAFMGHADPGAEAHAIHSGLNFHDLKELREALDGIADELGVITFRGLNA